MGAELRHAVRSLRRAPGFLAASVLLLVLAIAPTVGIFRLADVVLLRQLSTPRPDELVIFEKVAMDGDTDTSFSYPVYRDLRDRGRAIPRSRVRRFRGRTAERRHDRTRGSRARVRQLLPVFTDEGVSRAPTLA